jgi:hypothetical protein
MWAWTLTTKYQNSIPKAVYSQSEWLAFPGIIGALKRAQRPAVLAWLVFDLTAESGNTKESSQID